MSSALTRISRIFPMARASSTPSLLSADRGAEGDDIDHRDGHHGHEHEPESENEPADDRGQPRRFRRLGKPPGEGFVRRRWVLVLHLRSSRKVGIPPRRL
jgi:hypothetical protein